MLTQDDIKAIGTIVGEQIELKVPPIIKAGVDDLEMRMNVKFDAIHEEFETLKNTVVTKSYLDEKLALYVKKPF